MSIVLFGKTPTQRAIALIRGQFASGEQGVWYDPSDFLTMWQDSAGTTPVTAVTQPVGKILDKSGRGNHASQATAGARPTLQQDASGHYYLLFDGTDDALATGSIDFTATDKMTVLAGERRLGSSSGLMLELGTGTVANEFFLGANAVANDYWCSLGGDSAYTAASYASPRTDVLTASYDIGGAAANDEKKLRVNGSPITFASNGGANTGNFINSPLYIGARAGTSMFFSGHLYSLIVRGALSTDAQIASIETYVNGKTGAWA